MDLVSDSDTSNSVDGNGDDEVTVTSNSVDERSCSSLVLSSTSNSVDILEDDEVTVTSNSVDGLKNDERSTREQDEMISVSNVRWSDRTTIVTSRVESGPINLQTLTFKKAKPGWGVLMERSKERCLTFPEIEVIFQYRNCEPNLIPVSHKDALPENEKDGLYFYNVRSFKDTNGWDPINNQRNVQSNNVNMGLPKFNFTEATKTYVNGTELLRRTHRSRKRYGDLALVHYRWSIVDPETTRIGLQSEKLALQVLEEPVEVFVPLPLKWGNELFYQIQEAKEQERIRKEKNLDPETTRIGLQSEELALQVLEEGQEPVEVSVPLPLKWGNELFYQIQEAKEKERIRKGKNI